jgi:hypothetical protein
LASHEGWLAQVLKFQYQSLILYCPIFHVYGWGWGNNQHTMLNTVNSGTTPTNECGWRSAFVGSVALLVLHDQINLHQVQQQKGCNPPPYDETQACTIFTQTVNHSLLTIVGKWKVWMRENKIPKLIESARKLHILLTLSVNSPAVGTIFGGEWGQSSKLGSLVGTMILS